MTKKPLIVLGSIVLGLSLLLIHLPKEPACKKLHAKIALSDDFCTGMAKEAAEERCSQLSDSPEVLGKCKHVIIPAAHSACLDYVGKQGLIRQYQSLCE
jgi:hypothetical protein